MAQFDTVFTHGITSKEKEVIGISFKDESEYLKRMDKDTALFDLAFLYSHRKDYKMAEYFANQLPELDKLDCLRTIYHP